MTSKQAMHSAAAGRRLGVWTRVLGFLGMVVLALGGCGLLTPPPPEPKAFPSPYPAGKLWAVAPFRNESGTSIADGIAMADRLTQHLQQVQGIDALPVNRVLAAMDSERIGTIDSVDKAHRLMRVLKVDGLLVGTVTAWDPYDPPKIGAAVQLYRRRIPGTAGRVDPRKLSRAATTDELPAPVNSEPPIAEVAHYFDAANGTTRKLLRHYAHGRAPTDSPAGWRRYVLDMDLYSRFVSHELMRRLLKAEWRRVRPKTETRQGEPGEQDAAASEAPGADTGATAGPRVPDSLSEP